jgi:tRNA(Ile)-lysidine synthase
VRSDRLIEAFRNALRGCGPFEPRPVIAAAVSGGGDSLAMLLLLNEALAELGGEVIALTVDHGLRDASAGEAQTVSDFCRSRSIRHEILRWQHDGVSSGLQAEARIARYRLMTGWCRDHGIIHLAVAHNREDQSETITMRRERQADGPGLAGMASVRTIDGVRLIRPCLSLAGEDLRDWLALRGIDWIEDPSNRDLKFERVRVRASGDYPQVQTDAARQRMELEARAAELLAPNVIMQPEGYAIFPDVMLSGDEAVAALALAAVLRTVSGSAYRMVPDKAEALRVRLLTGGQQQITAGGCLIRRSGEGWMVLRELARVPVVPLGQALIDGWDNRFRISVGTAVARDDIMVGPLGHQDLSLRPLASESGIPLQVLRVMPGLLRNGELPAPVRIPGGLEVTGDFEARFDPRNPLFDGARWLAPAVCEPIL